MKENKNVKLIKEAEVVEATQNEENPKNKEQNKEEEKQNEKEIMQYIAELSYQNNCFKVSEVTDEEEIKKQTFDNYITVAKMTGVADERYYVGIRWNRSKTVHGAFEYIFFSDKKKELVDSINISIIQSIPSKLGIALKLSGNIKKPDELRVETEQKYEEALRSAVFGIRSFQIDNILETEEKVKLLDIFKRNVSKSNMGMCVDNYVDTEYLHQLFQEIMEQIIEDGIGIRLNKVAIQDSKVYVTKDYKEKIYNYIKEHLDIPNQKMSQFLADNGLLVHGTENSSRKNFSGEKIERNRYQIKRTTDIPLDVSTSTWITVFNYAVPEDLKPKVVCCEISAKKREERLKKLEPNASIEKYARAMANAITGEYVDVKTFPYFGSKKRQLLAIAYVLRKIGCDGHNKIIDGFCGSAVVGLNMKNNFFKNSKVVINDLNPEIVNFFRIMQDKNKYKELCSLIQEQTYNEETFLDAMDMRKKYKKEKINLTEIERALYFYITFTQCRNGDSKMGFGRGHEKEETFYSRIKNIEKLHKQLQNVDILNEDILELIPKMDKPENILYLDVPYLQLLRKAGGYEYDNGDVEFQKKFLRTCKEVKRAKVIIAGYYDKDSELTHECDYNAILGEGWYQALEGEYSKSTSNSEGGKPVAEEYIWCNFDLGEKISNPCLTEIEDSIMDIIASIYTDSESTESEE